MKKQTNDFLFCQQNKEQLDIDLTSLDLIVTSGIIDVLGCGFYIVDYEENKVCIISDNIAKMCGLNLPRIIFILTDFYCIRLLNL